MYETWKLDIIAHDLQGISTDHRIIGNLDLIKKLFSGKAFTPKEALRLASIYDNEFEENEIYVSGGYTPWAIKERFEAGREGLKKTIWDRYVASREDTIQSVVRWKNKKQGKVT